MHRTILLTLTALVGVGLVACSSGTSRVPEDPQEAAALAFALETRLQRAYLDELLASRGWDGEGPPPWERPVSRLGQELFFDPVLSVDGSVSCATCHDPRRAFTDGRTVFRGLDDFLGQRNTPTILNVGLMRELFWDGRARNLEEQADLVITSPVEMGHSSVAAVAAELAARPHYDAAFREVFGTPPTAATVRTALTEFQRSLVFLDAPVDRFLAGDDSALDTSQKRGWDLFRGRALCATCHVISEENPLGTDFQYHNIGISMVTPGFDRLAGRAIRVSNQMITAVRIHDDAVSSPLSVVGRFAVTRLPADVGAFRTPMLRNVALTQPYMHDGSLRTLREVVEYYNEGARPHELLDPVIMPLNLSPREVDDLVAFLRALTDDGLLAMNERGPGRS